MRGVWLLPMAAVGGLCASTWAGEFDRLTQRVRKSFGRLRATVVAERRNAGWRVIGLTLHDSALTDAGLKRVADLRALESLELRGDVGVTDEGWHSLAPLSELRSLTLMRNRNLTGDAFESLAGLVKLDSLDLYGCGQLTDAGLGRLRGLPGLRRLNLAVCRIGDALLAQVGALHGLEELDLSWNERISDVGLAQLTGLAKLRSLTIDNVGGKGVAALMSLPRLEVLTIQHYASEADVLDLSGMTALKSLTLGNFRQEGAWSVRLPLALRRLQLGMHGFIPKAGQRLSLLAPLPPQLESLDVVMPVPWEEGLTDRPDLGWVRSLAELRQLRVENAYKDEFATIGGLARLHALSLNVSCRVGRVSEDCIKQLTGLTRLESLAIENCEEVTDSGIRLLGSFPRLKRLELKWTRVTTAGLASIWELTGLEVLHLYLESQDKGLAGIASLPNLQELSLSGKVTDKGLESLAKLKKLRRLDLGGSWGYTDEGLAALVKALPDLKVLVWRCLAAAETR